MRPYLRVANVFEDRIDTSDVLEMNFSPDDFEKYRLEEGDVLLNEGQSRELVGRPAIYRGEVQGACFQNTLVRFQPRDFLLPEFALSVFRHYLHSGRFAEISKWTTSIAHLGAGRFSQLEFPVPPLNEQRRIVAKIEELTARSRAAKQALDAIPTLLERFRQSVLAAAFRGDLTNQWRNQNSTAEPASELLKRIRQERRHRWEQGYLEKQKVKGKEPKNDRWKAKYKDWEPQGNRSEVAAKGIREVRKESFPETWEVCYLGEVSELQPGYAFKSKWYQSEGIRLLRGTNIIPGGTRWEDTVCIEPERESEFVEYQLNPEDIVIAMDRPLISSGLKVAQLSEADLPALLLQRVGRFKRSRHIKPAFIYWYLNSVRFMNHIGVHATGTQLPHISKSDIETAPIPIPPLHEQDAIVDCLERVFSGYRTIVQATHDGHAQIARLNQSILAKAFRGELVPQDPTDEPASERITRQEVSKEKSKITGHVVRRYSTTTEKTSKVKKSVVEALNYLNKPATPEELFKAAGFEQDEVDLFYSQIRAAIVDQLIFQDPARPNSEDASVLLSLKR